MTDLVSWRGPAHHQHGDGVDGTTWVLREGQPCGHWRFWLKRDGVHVSGYATEALAKAAADRWVVRSLNNWTTTAEAR